MNKMMRRRLAALYCLCVAQPCAATAAAAATATKSTATAQQTVKYAGNQTELLDAIGNDTTAILTGNIDLEYSMDIASSDTGIVIENVQGFVIDGAGFAINGRGSMRCLYVGGSGTTVELRNLTVTNGSSTGSSTNGGGIYVGQGAATTLTTSPVTNNTASYVSVPWDRPDPTTTMHPNCPPRLTSLLSLTFYRSLPHACLLSLLLLLLLCTAWRWNSRG